MRKPLTLFGAALFVALAAACATEKDPTPIAVTATDTTCVASTAEVEPGRVKLNIDNQGTRITEVYVYAPNDRTIDEIEFIEAGKKGDLLVELGGGDYEITCKPGMVGDGYRSPLHVTGPPAPTGPDDVLDRATARGIDAFTIPFEAQDDGFNLQTHLAFVPGQTITFMMRNTSTSAHQFQVVAPDGSVLGAIPSTAPGSAGSVAVTFDNLGTYQFLDPAFPAPSGFAGTFEVVK